MLFKLDSFGICASAGSACSSANSEPSHVLVAIGTPKELINSSLRVTFGAENTKEQEDYLIGSIEKIINIH